MTTPEEHLAVSDTSNQITRVVYKTCGQSYESDRNSNIVILCGDRSFLVEEISNDHK